MKFEFDIIELDASKAVEFIQEQHYSKVMPRLTKHYLASFI